MTKTQVEVITSVQRRRCDSQAECFVIPSPHGFWR
jgi:hypothetical protein